MRVQTSLPLMAALALAPTAAWAQAETETRDAKFERVEQVGKHRLLLLEGGGSYRMTERTFARHERLWFFVKKGDKIHLTVKRGWVLQIEKGWKTEESVQSALLARLRAAREGTRVFVNGEPYLFVGFEGGVLKLSPKLPGGDFGYAGERLLSLDEVETFVPAPAEEQPTVDLANDTLHIFKVEVGDTVELRLSGSASPLQGAIAGLSPTTCELLEWRNGDWAERRRLPRPQIERVTHVWLQGRRRVRLENGELSVTVSRFRRATTGPLELKLEVSHDMAGAILTGLEVQVHLRDAVAGGSLLGLDKLEIPPLLPRRPYRATHEVARADALDADVLPANVITVPFESPEARAPLLQALGGGAGLKEMRSLYQGAGRAQDPALVRLLLTRALYPPARSGESAEDHAAAAREGLIAAGDVALDALYDELAAKPDALQLTTLQKGALTQEPLPEATPPLEHQRALVGLLPELPGAMAGHRGHALYALWASRTDLAPAIEGAFGARPDAAAPLLLGLAVPPQRGVPKEKTDAAKALLLGLGRPAFDALGEALRERGADLDRFEQARQQHGERPRRVIEAALELAQELRAARWQEQLGGKLEEAEELGRAGRLGEAIRLTREVLEVDPSSKAAKKTLAELLHDQAIDKEAEGLTGEAALLLEEAIAHRPASRAKLAALTLEGLEQDLGVVAVRAQPHLAAAKVSALTEGRRLPGKPLGAQWVEVESDVGTGYVHRTCLEPSGSSMQVAAPARTPAVVIERGVERVKELDATQAAAADRLLGRFYAGEAERLYQAGEHTAAIDAFERAAELAPDDPRLSLQTGNWVRANLALLGLLVVVISGGGAGLAVLLARHRAETRARQEAINARDTAALRIDLFESDMGVTLEEEQGPPEGGDPPPPA